MCNDHIPVWQPVATVAQFVPVCWFSFIAHDLTLLWCVTLVVMFFGLTNSPATFQHFMNNTLSDYIAEGWLTVYMDDILISSNDITMHHDHTRQVIE